jgi:beta-lactamase class A
MHRVESAEELQQLMATPSDQLPAKAKPPTSGFYAKWQASPPAKRKQLAGAAFKREKARVKRQQDRRAHDALP